MAVMLSDLLRNLTFNRSAHCTQVSDKSPLGLLFLAPPRTTVFMSLIISSWLVNSCFIKFISTLIKLYQFLNKENMHDKDRIAI